MLIDIKDLAKKYNVQSKGVLHIGAHLGQEAQTYADLGMNKMVFIEANPSIYDQLRTNISKYPNAKAVKACVSERDGDTVTFNISSNEGQSSSILEFGTHKTQHADVSFTGSLEMTTTRVDTALKEFDMKGIDFLNIDLQGAELLALKSMGALIHNFRYAYLEVNKEEVYKGCALIAEIDAFLGVYGFVRKETEWTGGWGDAFYTKEGKEVLPGTFSVPLVANSPASHTPKEEGMIVQVDQNFLPVSANFEAWFAENITSAELKERMYLPIQWSAYYAKNKNGRDRITWGHLQYVLDNLDKSKKYFTIVEWPEGIVNYFNGADIKVFGTGDINVDVKLDLSMPKEEVKKLILSQV